ncbi:MAG: biotin--[acetyl-CoA-carboxylase] ligase [Balneolaceae bacterium]
MTFQTEIFRKELRTQWLGADFIYRDTVGSTNTVLKTLPDRELTHGTVLLADSQTGGRGQNQRHWESEPGKNLTFTIAFKPAHADRLPLLTLSTAWSVRQALARHCPGEYTVKWPNDLMLEGRKIGGILTECLFNGQRLNRALVGIGVNVGQTTFSPDVADSATSLALHLDQTPGREILLADILLAVEDGYRKWHHYDAAFLKQVNRSLIGYGEWVGLSVNGKRLKEQVKFLGINEKSQLVIVTSDLEIKTYSYEQVRIFRDDSAG